MKLPDNPFKHALAARKQQIGLWSSLASHGSVELLAGAGFDWLLLDMEHAPNELPMVHSQLQATMGSSTHPIVRPPWNEMVTIKRLLDIGVQTLLIPYVETEEEARNAVAYTRYPPEGVRGYASASRASGFGRVADYPKRCASELCVLVQIESRLGLDNLERIAAVEGIDGVFIGPGDLAAALGHVGEIKHPDVQAVIEDSIRRIVAAGKPAGILTPDEALARRYIELGCTFTAVGSDVGILGRGAEQLAARFKSA
ncbi:2-dehydro-3-deoxyglucarate aldolase [Trinickia violacea]|uniref:2-dehydro-3-deoxyglucarate aldolase n=1 Tax=Trinickia violacea TaxID=2571746 RepID=A0A4P8IW72_9BURK|nr:HpcH/HpaI aldolase/citrate lyase family protein [Trinickia violacea]QCP53578.1 2-dehydro-3-deoxyglucarate aldolase [Trinickia violacea]